MFRIPYTKPSVTEIQLNTMQKRKDTKKVFKKDYSKVCSKGCNKVQGQTFLVEEVVAGIRKALEEE